MNNAKDYRYKYNLQSILNLDYTNYKIVIADDASVDNTYELILEEVAYYQSIPSNPKRDIVVVHNKERMSAGPTTYFAIHNHCSSDSIVVIVDGDDEILGPFPLKVFNSVYHKWDLEMLWSNHLQYYFNDMKIYQGWSKFYKKD